MKRSARTQKALTSETTPPRPSAELVAGRLRSKTPSSWKGAPAAGRADGRQTWSAATAAAVAGSSRATVPDPSHSHTDGEARRPDSATGVDADGDHERASEGGDEGDGARSPGSCGEVPPRELGDGERPSTMGECGGPSCGMGLSPSAASASFTLAPKRRHGMFRST